MQTLEFSQPYHSTLLTSRQKTRKLSPKVTQVKPQIKSVIPFHIKQHQLDDTQMKQALYYNWQDSPRVYEFSGQRQVFSKQNYFSNRSNYHQLKVNSDYFDTKPFKQIKSPLQQKNNDSQQFNKRQKRCSSMQSENVCQHLQNNLNLNNRIQQKIQNLCVQNKKLADALKTNFNYETIKTNYNSQKYIQNQKPLNVRQIQKEKEKQLRKYYKSESNKKLQKQVKSIKAKLAKDKQLISKNQLKSQKNKLELIQTQLNELKSAKKIKNFENELEPHFQQYKQVEIKVKQTNKRVQCNQLNIKIQTKPQFKCKNVNQSDTDSQFSDF